MKGFHWWIEQFYNYIPEWNKSNIIALLCFVLIVWFAVRCLKVHFYLSSGQCILIFLAGVYIAIVCISTVIGRKSYSGVHIRISIIWIFTQIKQYGVSFVLREILFNILLLVPYGVIVQCCFDKRKTRTIVIVGFSISLFIEVLQFITQKGVFEVNDLLFNTVGVLLACHIVNTIKQFHLEMK